MKTRRRSLRPQKTAYANLQDEDWEDEGEEGEIEDDNEEWDDHDEFE